MSRGSQAKTFARESSVATELPGRHITHRMRRRLAQNSNAGGASSLVDHRGWLVDSTGQAALQRLTPGV